MKIKLFKIIICLFLAQGLLTDCTMQKRVHRKGYHVSWSHKHSSEYKKQQSLGIMTQASVNRDSEKDEMFSANSDRSIDPTSLKGKSALVLNKDAHSEEFVNKSVQELKVRSLKINEHVKKNKYCENSEDQLLSKSKIKARFIYANRTDVHTSNLNSYLGSTQKKNYRSRKTGKVNVLGLSSLLLFALYIIVSIIMLYSFVNYGFVFLFLYIFPVFPLIVAYVSLFQFKREPKKYRGKWMPIALVCFYLAINLFYVVLATVLAIWGWVPAFIYAAILALFFVLLSVFIAALIPQG